MLHFVRSVVVKIIVSSLIKQSKASSKETFELLSRICFTATDNSWAVRSLVCLNKGQRLVPCYWPFYRSERHQLGKAVTMPPVTFPLWCEQPFTDHGAQLSRGNWEIDRDGRNDWFVLSILTPFQRKKFCNIHVNSVFTFYLKKTKKNLLTVLCCSLIAVVLVRLSRSATGTLSEIPQATWTIWPPQYAHWQSILMSPQTDSDLVLILLHSHTADT